MREQVVAGRIPINEYRHGRRLEGKSGILLWIPYDTYRHTYVHTYVYIRDCWAMATFASSQHMERGKQISTEDTVGSRSSNDLYFSRAVFYLLLGAQIRPRTNENPGEPIASACRGPTGPLGSGLGPYIYAEAPLMKNHLSIEASIFSGGSSWLAGMGGSWSGETRLGDWLTVRLVLAGGGMLAGPWGSREGLGRTRT